MSKRVFVTGASGFLGSHLVKQLVQRGYEVRALVYEPDREAWIRGLGAATVVGGFDESVLLEGMRGCDGVFHVAGYVSLIDKTGEISSAVNIDGTRKVMDAALKSGVKRVVHTSSLVTIGATRDGRIIDESHDGWNLGETIGLWYIKTKKAGEDLALGYNARGLEVIVGNPGGMIGPDDFFASEASQMFSEFLAGHLRVCPDLRNNWVDVRDVAAGEILAYEKGRPGDRYMLGCENTQMVELINRLAEIEGRHRVLFRLRYPLTLAIGVVLNNVLGKPLITPQSARFMAHAFWISSDKAKRELGYNPRPIDGTLRESLAWHKAYILAGRPGPDFRMPGV